MSVRLTSLSISHLSFCNRFVTHRSFRLVAERNVWNNGRAARVNLPLAAAPTNSYSPPPRTDLSYRPPLHFVSVGRRTARRVQCTWVKMSEIKKFERLPATVRPRHYDLTLVPDLKKLDFQGRVAVDIEVKESTKTIILNALSLNIKKVELEGKGKTVSSKDVDLIQDDEIAKITFEEPIAPGDYKLHVTFSGSLNDKMKGFYRSKYMSVTGEERYAAVTQFEPTDARQCFPCWDEPSLKATFNINLTVPKELVALSNMPVKLSEDNEDGTVSYAFERTPIMSTYLVAVVIGEYDYIEDRSSDGVLVRVYTPKNKTDQGRFALEVATKVLPYYKYYFDIAYPLPKIDLIAIADFSAGAMENWGLVTYRESCLLVDPKNTSAVRKQWIAIVVSHELAHQWFGNLVTMEWWTHLWLNEGYAQFTEFLCVDHLFPSYDIWKQFVSETYIRALELDALNNSHPIEVPVEHPHEIDEIFDDISYNKGASVIRMLNRWIGEETFRKGMNLYLTKHQYKNTFTEDLWASLEEASKQPVGAVMSTWTKQMGFPVVRVTIKKNSKPGGVTLQFSQEKFTADGSKPNGDFTWMIPITVSTSKNPGKEAASMVLKTKDGELFVPDIDANKDWVKINPGTVGYYRTQYTPEMLERLIPALRDQSLPPLDRLGLLDDLFALVQASHVSTVEVLKLLEAFVDETDYTVWSSICNILGKLDVLISYTKFSEAFKQLERRVLKKISKRLMWDAKEGETHLDTLLRGLILGRIAWLDDADAIAEARRRFTQHVAGTTPLPADIRAACYKTVLRAGGTDEYSKLMQLYRQTDLHEEKDRISRSLGVTKDPELLKKVLKFSMSDEVRSQDTVFVIMSVATTRQGRDLAWQFYKDNWETLVDRYDGGGLLTRLIKFTTENYASEEMALEVEKFFKENKVPGAERSVQQAVETIRLNAAWLKRDIEKVGEYLLP